MTFVPRHPGRSDFSWEPVTLCISRESLVPLLSLFTGWSRVSLVSVHSGKPWWTIVSWFPLFTFGQVPYWLAFL